MKKKGIVIALCVLSAFAFLGCSALTGTPDAVSPADQTVTVTKGDLVQTVSGPGVLKFVDAVEQKTPAAVKITNVKVKVGDAVAKGDVVASFDATALSAEIARLSASVTQLRQQEQGFARSYRSDRTLTAGVRGRVKELYIEKGDDIGAIVAEKGGIALVSADGQMTVTFPSASLAANDEVKVVLDRYSCKGIVSRVENGDVTVSFTDAKVLPGETVQVYDGDMLLGSGAAQVHVPYLIPADSGIVISVYVKVNESISFMQPITRIKYVAINDSYQAALDQLAQAQSDLEAAKALRDQGALLAEEDGVVASVLPEGTYPSGTNLLTYYPKGQFEFTVSVDELDIFSVAVGQKAAIQFDGVADKSFNAAVTKISSVGQVANGFTTYLVTLSVVDDGTLKSGLNGTVQITVNQSAGALLLPVEAIQEDANGSYVTLSGSPQTKTPVQTGISDGRSIEIVSGLSEGDAVVIRAAADILAGQ